MWKLSLKLKCLLIGLLHMLVIFLRVYDTVWDFVAYEESVDSKEVIDLLIPILVQLILAITLIYGTITERPIFLVIWFSFAFVLGLITGGYGAFYLFATNDYRQSLINFICIGCIWYGFYVVRKNYQELKKSQKNILK